MDKVSKISAMIGYIGRKSKLSMNVVVSDTNLNQNSNRKFRPDSFYTETEFYSDKANQRLVNIKLNLNYYLSYEYRDETENTYFVIRDYCMPYINAKLEEYCNLYLHGDMFAKVDGKYIVDRTNAKAISINNLPFGCYFVLAPVVIDKEDTTVPATKIYLNSKTTYDILESDSLFRLKHTFATIDMFNAAMNLLNFYGRPDEGTNRFIVKY